MYDICVQPDRAGQGEMGAEPADPQSTDGPQDQDSAAPKGVASWFGLSKSKCDLRQDESNRDTGGGSWDRENGT